MLPPAGAGGTADAAPGVSGAVGAASGMGGADMAGFPEGFFRAGAGGSVPV